MANWTCHMPREVPVQGPMGWGVIRFAIEPRPEDYLHGFRGYTPQDYANLERIAVTEPYLPPDVVARSVGAAEKLITAITNECLQKPGGQELGPNTQRCFLEVRDHPDLITRDVCRSELIYMLTRWNITIENLPYISARIAGSEIGRKPNLFAHLVQKLVMVLGKSPASISFHSWGLMELLRQLFHISYGITINDVPTYGPAQGPVGWRPRI